MEVATLSPAGNSVGFSDYTNPKVRILAFSNWAAYLFSSELCRGYRVQQFVDWAAAADEDDTYTSIST